MRPPILSLGACLFLASAALAQNAGENRNAPTLPVGQTFVQFEFPVYQNGQLKYSLYADKAVGITLNRAETTNITINIYDNGQTGQPTTVITSPKADLYAAEQKMRTKNTVKIERSDMEATSDECDFDVKSKKFLLRTKVHVLLKHFDVGAGTSSTSQSSPPAANGAAPATSAAAAVLPTHIDDSILPSPGTYSDTNAAALPPSRSPTK